MELESIIIAIVGLMGIIFTGVLTHFGTVNSNKKKATADERLQLSEDQKEFRKDIISRMDTLRSEVDRQDTKSRELEELVYQWKNKYIELDRDWQNKYLQIEFKNKILNHKIEILEKVLKQLNIDYSEIYQEELFLFSSKMEQEKEVKEDR